MSLSLKRDKPGQGTYYEDRMHRILGVCDKLRILQHTEKQLWHGQETLHVVQDIESAQIVRVTPQYEKYGLRVPNPAVLARLLNLRREMASYLNVSEVAIEQDGNLVYIRVPRDLGNTGGPVVTYERAWKLAPDLPTGSLLLGIDDNGHQLVLDMSDPRNVHAAAIGMTGSGKSTLLKTMVLSAQMIGHARMALLDPTGGLAPFAGHPSVWRGGLFQRAEDCELALGELTRTLDQAQGSHALLYIFVDEAPDLIMQRPAIADHLARLAQAGRHAGIHLILGAQHLLASQIGAMTLRNIPVRLIGRVSDPTASYNAAGRKDVGAELLRGRGDFMVINGGAKHHFQAAYIEPGVLDEWARRYPAHAPNVPVRFYGPPPPVVLPPEPPPPTRATRYSARNTPNTGRYHTVECTIHPPNVPAIADDSPRTGHGQALPRAGRGRGYDVIDAEILRWIQTQQQAGVTVTARMVRNQTKAVLGYEYNHGKALRAIDEARALPRQEGAA